MPPVSVDLSGVAETLLGNLGRRAAAARAGASSDPMAIQLVDRAPDATLVFDVVPKVMLDLVQRGSGHERDLAVELWTWLFDRDERDAIRALPGVEQLRDLLPPRRPDPVTLGIAAVARLPQRLRYSLPVIPVLHATLRTIPTS